MAAKNISLSEDVYEALLAIRLPGESFSDTVRRLARRRSLTELSGIMDAKGAEALAKAIDANRKDRVALRRKKLGL